MAFIRFQAEDSAGNNGTCRIAYTSDATNVFYRAAGLLPVTLWTKDVGGTSGHCKVIDYVFDKYFPEYRAQKPTCLISGQYFDITIQDGHGIYIANNRVRFQNGEQYSLSTSPDSVLNIGYWKRGVPITNAVRLNDFANSKLTYIGSRSLDRSVDLHLK